MLIINEDSIMRFYTDISVTNPSPKMTLRVGHIKDVVRHGDAIAEAVHLDQHGRSLLKLVAYLHDYYQVLQIAGDAPNPHAHHANPEAVEAVLFADNQIDQYATGLTDFDKTVVKTAIVQHASLAVDLPDNADPHLWLFSDLLRDADKSAIYELIRNPRRVLADDHGYTADQIAHSRSKDGAFTGISNLVAQSFLVGQCINNNDVKTPADWAINQLAYLYDVKTSAARHSMLTSAATFIDNLPFSDAINTTLRSMYYHALNRLLIRP